MSVASSADGTKLVAATFIGQIYTSTDSGVSWTARESTRNWYSVASSADGTKLVAVVYQGRIYTSTDSGVSWTARESNQRGWSSVASSADGTKLVAATFQGQIYTSTDYGVNWSLATNSVRQTSNNGSSLAPVAMSSDGSTIIAGYRFGSAGGYVYTSRDFGVTWAPSLTDQNRQWFGVTSSADGSKLVVVGPGHQIYTSASPKGVVLGIKSRIYNAVSTQLNLLRNFVDSAWTIVADNTLVKLLYNNLIDIFGRDSNTTTTLVEQNNGFILHPLATGIPVTRCGVLDVPNATYTLASSTNFNNYAYDTCFIIRADGVTINGNNTVIRANSSSTSLYGILATSTPSVDGTYNAFSNLTVKNLKFVNFRYAANVSGTSNPTGNGGNAGTITVSTSTFNASILARGGDGKNNGGNGGTISIINTNVRGFVASSTLSADGGSSTECGNGGDAGTVNTINSGFDGVSVVVGSGANINCPNNPPPNGSPGSSGTYYGTGGNQVINFDPVADSSPQPQTPASQGPLDTLSQSPQITGSASVGPGGIFSVLPPVANVGKLYLKPLPIFGVDDSKNGFSFVSNFENYLFKPIDVTIHLKDAPLLKKYLASLGIVYDQNLLTLRTKSIPIPPTIHIPGIYFVTTNLLPIKTVGGFKTTETSLTTYLSSNTLYPLTEVVDAFADSTITVSFMPTSKGAPSATFNGKPIVLGKVGAMYVARILTPHSPGTYMFRASNSPLPLSIVVPRPQVLDAPAPWSRIPSLFQWIQKIF